MIKQIDVRFFCYCITNAHDIDICEVNEDTFLQLGGDITYKRDTLFETGCRQICLTTAPDEYPMLRDIELKEGIK